MDFKCYLSEASVDFLEEALEQMQQWHFDAINAEVLLSTLVDITDTTFKMYLMGHEVMEDEIMDTVSMNFSERIAEIKIKEEDKKEGKEEKPSEEKKEEKSDGKLDEKEVLKQVFNYKSEHDADVRIKDYKGKEHVFPVSASVQKIIDTLGEMCAEYGAEQIEPVYFVSAAFKAEDSVMKKFFKEIALSYTEAKKYYLDRDIFKGGNIPYLLQSFLANMNEGVDISKPCEILCRDREAEQIWTISQKRYKRNTIIVGEAGVGKSALVEKIVYDIVSGNCPERFKNFYVVSLDVNSLIAGTKYRGDAEDRIKELISFLRERNDVILFIDEVHTILGAGSCYEGEMDLANALKPILARGDTIVIGATTENEYIKYFSRDAALSRRFEKVVVEEPRSEDVYPMIRNKISAYSQFHGIRISKSMVEYAILISNCFAFEKKNPDKTLDLIDRSMVSAIKAGKKQVDKECILCNFNIYTELLEGMGEEARKAVAYHEAGHFVVGFCSGRLIDYHFLALSIMPAEDYLGVTVHEKRKNVLPFENLEYFVDLIAFKLAGRVAENIYRGEYTSGAGADLYDATQVALEVVSKLGMTVDVGSKRNNVFINTPDYPMFTEKTANLINDEVQELISRSYKRAEQIIEENKMFLDMLVKELLTKRIMSEVELNRVWKRYLKKKEKLQSAEK